MYGQYTKELKDFAKTEARRQQKSHLGGKAEDVPEGFEEYKVSRCQEVKRKQ